MNDILQIISNLQYCKLAYVLNVYACLTYDSRKSLTPYIHQIESQTNYYIQCSHNQICRMKYTWHK